MKSKCCYLAVHQPQQNQSNTIFHLTLKPRFMDKILYEIVIYIRYHEQMGKEQLLKFLIINIGAI